MVSRTQTPMIVSMSERILTGVRLVLALSALLLSRIDPPEPEPSGGLTPVLLALYLVFSGVLYVSSRRGRAFLSTPFIYLLDVAWYTGVILYSGGTNSIFFYLFFFAILAASFQWGCAAGLRVAVASATASRASPTRGPPHNSDGCLPRSGRDYTRGRRLARLIPWHNCAPHLGGFAQGDSGKNGRTRPSKIGVLADEPHAPAAYIYKGDNKRSRCGRPSRRWGTASGR